MQEENYKILGVSPSASNEEIEKAYKKLRDKYLEDRFLEGELGNNAAKNLTKIETAYYEIIQARKEIEQEDTKNFSEDFSKVEEAIKSGNISLAQDELDNISTREAEWHYYQSIVFYKKNWYNESKKQLEIAMSIEPSNTKYSEAYQKLNVKMEAGEKIFNSGNAESGSNKTQKTNRQMGGTDNECCAFCLTWCCMDMLCNMCCRL